MRADVIRLYKSVHTWTGIVAGMALFIAFYAGALTVFKEPIARWVSPPATPSSPGAAAVPLEQTPQLIARTLAEHPAAAKGFRIHLQEQENVPARMGWVERPTGGDDHDESESRRYLATLQADGTPLIEESRQSRVAEFIDVLHRVVGLPFDSDPNRWVMGIVCALYAMALISGTIVLIPSLVKDFFALRLGRNLKRMWLDAHNVIGIVSLPFHVVMALTAAVFAFHDGIYFIQDRTIHQGQLAREWRRQPPKGEQPPPRDVSTMLPPAELVARVQALSPTLRPVGLDYQQPTTPRAQVRVWVRDDTGYRRSPIGGFAALDPYTGRIRSTDYLPGSQSTGAAIISSFFALHFATFGGTAVQWMYFLLGLAGAFLFYSGNLLWVETRRRRAGRGQGAPVLQKRSSFLMAAATVGVCLGCVAGVSATLVAGKWLHGRVADIDAWHMGVYYVVFLGAVIHAFARGVARAAPQLLWLAALCTAAIPLTTLVGWLWPGAGPWAHGSAAALGVDAVALAGALGLAWMARATARRVREGQADSVWSLSAPRGAQAATAKAADAAPALTQEPASDAAR